MLLERYSLPCLQMDFPKLLAYLLYLMQFAGSAWEALKHIRQAVDFLVRVLFNLLNISSPIVFYSQIHFIPIFHFCQVISLKPMRTLREIRADVCQVSI